MKDRKPTATSSKKTNDANTALFRTSSKWVITVLILVANSRQQQQCEAASTTRKWGVTTTGGRNPSSLLIFGSRYNENILLSTATNDEDDNYTMPSLNSKPSTRATHPLLIRGGASSSSAATASTIKKTSATSKSRSKSKKKSPASSGSVKRKHRSKSTPKEDDSSSKEGKTAIEKAMEQDSAQILGDAIRNRAEELRSENPLLDRIDQSIYSVGWALGASDYPRPRRLNLGSTDGGSSSINNSNNLNDQRNSDATAVAADDDGGGVEGSPTAVLVSYFLKSHGGAHALQCVCSLLASSAAMASLVVPSSAKQMKLVLLKRTMMFAMIKHVAGLLGASLVAAKAIPDVGLRKARVWMEQLARDPVSQYVFYTACILLWLPAQATSGIVLSAEKFPWIPFVLVGPILLREVVSTMLVISDVLVLWAASISSVTLPGDDDRDYDDGDSGAQAIQAFLNMSQKPVNIVMSLLVTPGRWRSADSAARQQLLAKLTSKVSLSMELVVGLVMVVDAVGRVGQLLFGTASGVKPSFLSVVQRLVYARLYVQFLWVRKRQVSRLVTKIRGGATQLPFYVLDVLLDPRAAMGLPTGAARKKSTRREVRSGASTMTWKDYAMVALGLDE